MSKLVKRFKSAIKPTAGVSVFRGEKGFFYTVSNARFVKDSNKWEENPFYDVATLAALRSCLDKAMSWADENQFRREQGSEPAKVESTDTQSKLDEMEDIPF